MIRSGLKNTPSPRGSGERVGVRGKGPSIFIGEKTPCAAPSPYPSPPTGGEGIFEMGSNRIQTTNLEFF